jgi:hypothetical protein
MTKPQMETRKQGISTNLQKKCILFFHQQLFDQTKIVLCLINEVGKKVILSMQVYTKI